VETGRRVPAGPVRTENDETLPSVYHPRRAGCAERDIRCGASEPRCFGPRRGWKCAADVDVVQASDRAVWRDSLRPAAERQSVTLPQFSAPMITSAAATPSRWRTRKRCAAKRLRRREQEPSTNRPPTTMGRNIRPCLTTRLATLHQRRSMLGASWRTCEEIAPRSSRLEHHARLARRAG